MMMRLFNWDVLVGIVGNGVKDWEMSRDKEDAERRLREVLSGAGFTVTSASLRNMIKMCDKCSGHMNENDNFCSTCGEKA